MEENHEQEEPLLWFSLEGKARQGRAGQGRVADLGFATLKILADSEG